ncbi:MAG: hypothetical protein JXR91_00895 [Deltaproteobacteria bacterium]|nr:hypothetical protein [Deltaproteobacteria bacterium]
MQGVLKKLFVTINIAVFTIIISASSTVFAQTPTQKVEAKGVGVSGGVLLGGEIVLAIEAAAKVKPLWAWLVFPAVGAAGGGVGGYFVEKSSTGGAIAMLVTGMVALIPTAIAVSASHRYNPENEGAVEGDTTKEDGKFSFEQDPVSLKVDNETTTEVESKPDVVESEGPPSPESGDTQTEDGASTGDETSDESAPDEAEPQSSLQKSHNDAMAHLSGGALFHVNKTNGFGFGIPAVDVKPLSLVFAQNFEDKVMQPTILGVEVNIPVLSIDLP